MQFQMRQVGKTQLKVTAMGLGGATLAGNMEAVTDEEARILVIDAFDSGIRYFDSAPFYGYGRSEHVVGDGLRDRADWVLSTKVGRLLRPRTRPQDANDAWQRPFPFEEAFDYSYDAIMRSYEDSLQRLGLNHIDILYMHDVDVFAGGTTGAAGDKMRKCIESTYKALDSLRSSGAIKAIGLGVNVPEPISEAMKLGQWDVFLLAGRYTLLEQTTLHTLLPEVERHGASIVIGGPFNSGILVGGETFNYAKAPQAVADKVKHIARVCQAHKVPLAAAALQFPLAHKVVASIIPGPRTATELNQILDWWRLRIPPGLWSDLKSERVLDEGAPVPT